MRNSLLLIAIASGCAFAQQYNISTIAGGSPAQTGAAANSVSVTPGGVATDSSGNLYFSSNHTVYKMASNGALTAVAGTSRAGYSGDGGPATAAQLNTPMGLAVTSQGIYIADSVNNVVRFVDKTGMISTFAGTGTPGYSGDAGPANQAYLFAPSAVAIDSKGNVYIADRLNHAVRRVTTDGNISSFAGGFALSWGYSGDAGPATAAQLNQPTSLAIDSKDNLYIADFGNSLIREVTSADGNINSVAGNHTPATAGDGAAATSGSLYEPFGVAVDGSGNIFVSQLDSRIRKVSGGKINTIAGNGSDGFGGDGSSASSATLMSPLGLAVDAAGNLYVADSGNNRVRKIATGGTITTVAGNGSVSYSGDGGPAVVAQMNGNSAVAVASSGVVYVADTYNHVVRQISASGVITNFAGTGVEGFGGDGGPANKAQLNFPTGLAIDASGTVYIADSANRRVRAVAANGNISTFAGNGSGGYTGDGGPAASATFLTPIGVAVDRASGAVYIADFSNGTVRKVMGGTITTAAGTGVSGYSGDGGKATAAQLNGPIALAVDTVGNLYVAEYNSNYVRFVAPNGAISTVAGNGSDGYSDDGKPAFGSLVAAPSGVVVDGNGNIYISVAGNRVYQVSNGILNTIAGSSTIGYTGDGGPAKNAAFNVTAGIAMDSAGRIYVCDSGNNAVRLLTPAQ